MVKVSEKRPDRGATPNLNAFAVKWLHRPFVYK